MASVLGMFVLLGVPHNIEATRSDMTIFRAFVYLSFLSWVAVIDMQKDVGAELRVVCHNVSHPKRCWCIK
jgi:hypothetical protein